MTGQTTSSFRIERWIDGGPFNVYLNGQFVAEFASRDQAESFTHPDLTPLEVGMDTNTELEEAAFFDLLAAREAAIQGATGALAMLNVPTERLQVVAKSTDNILSLAARILLYQRRVQGEIIPLYDADLNPINREDTND